ncbi:peptide MFS transporter [Clostridium tagluense]|uniref:peptide MFS transporter n=1 Tax=Clostridium tagluense TaxID=360422 RepID=UPI001CF4877D|nr:peptide MFS transporter [Clostridium tagluense]MCB2298738.1 peptide MFS transporter [Clostridium tagluense]
MATATNTQQQSLNNRQSYPIGFWFISLLQIFERFSYYGMRGLLILYLATSAVKGGLGLDTATASSLYASFTMFVYFAPLAGGYIADNFWGKRKTFFIGSIFIAAGMFALFAAHGKTMVLVALGLMIVGNGFWKPNITSIVGDFYGNNDPRKDGAYSIFYTFINIGAFFAPLICGTLAEKTFAVTKGTEVISYGYKYGFLAAGIGMLIGTILYILFAKKALGDVGAFNKEAAVKKAQAKKASTQAKKGALTKDEKKSVIAIFVLSFFVIIFWAGFEQAGSSLTIYTNDFINRSVGGFEVPTSWFQSINPFLCVVLGPLFAMLFVRLAKRPKGDIPTATKMGYGLILLGIGFALMVGAAMERGNSADAAIKANILWLIGAYTLHTVGEMFLSPVGLSMVSKLAPKQIAALMMGVWLFATGMGNYIAGMAAAFVETWGGLQVFGFVAAITIASGLLLCFISPLFDKVMRANKA